MIERDDPAMLEKKIDSEASSQNRSPEPSRIEHVDDKIWCSEEEALARARSQPDDTVPIYIGFGENDPSNPRNWSMTKKWYITCFASMLNVLT